MVGRMAGGRQEWMDVLRGLAMVFVLALHATLMVEWYDTAPWPPLVRLNLIFAPYRMPTLMLLSGLLLNRALGKGWVRYYRGKIEKVIYPLIVWAFVTRLVMDPYFEWWNPRDYVGPYHLWFVLFLAFFYLLAPMLERVNTLLVVAASLLVSQVSPEGSKYFEQMFCLMAFFFTGHYLGKHPDVLIRLTSSRAVLAALPAVAVLSVYASLYAGGYEIVYSPVLFLPIACGTVLLIALSRQVAGLDWTRPLAYLGRHSLIFYVSHYPLIFLVMGATLEAEIGLPLVALISFVAAIAVGTALTVLSQRTMLIRALFQFPAPLHRGSQAGLR